MNKHTFTMSIWEGNEYVIEADGKPIGGALTKRSAEAILEWLNTSELSK